MGELPEALADAANVEISAFENHLGPTGAATELLVGAELGGATFQRCMQTCKW